MLKFLPLFFANLRRKPVRTRLTIASIVVAFLLFGLLKTMEGALALAADLAGVDRLATMHKMSLIQKFPVSYLNRIRGVDGVVEATPFIWFGGIYQDERNQIAAQATEPETFFEVYPEYELPPEQRADWLSDRASMIVGKTLAERFGWKVGDTVPDPLVVLPQEPTAATRGTCGSPASTRRRTATTRACISTTTI